MPRKAQVKGDLCVCGHRRYVHVLQEGACRAGCERGCQEFRQQQSKDRKRSTMRYIATWRKVTPGSEFGHVIALTATGRVILHRTGGRQELSHFSSRMTADPEAMIRIVESSLEDGYTREQR